jgi:protein-tyrosine phosphatase
VAFRGCRPHHRQVLAIHFQRFDLLLAMDGENLAVMRAAAPEGHAHKARLFLEYAPECGQRNVPDPYYGGPHGFETVVDLAERGVRALFNALDSRDSAVPSIRR